MITDEFFMRRALELARLGMGRVSPNPMVGCVIVHDEKIIGEGWHQKYGQAHAEVNAIQSVKDQSLLTESTVYVNLEPCAHFGKTPPCADLLVRHRVQKVIIANQDTHPHVAGKGIKKLYDAGIEVVTGILAKEGNELNKRFFTSIEKHRPYIILKWAQTADGFLARENFDSKWVSNEYSRQLVHRWRSEEDAVLVGKNTALHDNPQLNVREWSGKNPIRIVMDRLKTLPENLHLFDGTQKTLCYNLLKNRQSNNLIFVKLNENHFLDEMVADLQDRRIQSVIVEGGAQTLQLFIDAGQWDEARIFTSSQSFGTGVRAPAIQGNLRSVEQLFSDELRIMSHGKNKY